MSSPRARWWPYAKSIIRAYPALQKQYEDLRFPAVTPCYSPLPRPKALSRALENLVLQELPPTSQREFDAVTKAIALTAPLPDGARRLKLIRMVLWNQSHTVEGAALLLDCSSKVARDWHGQFIRLTAACFGLFDD